MLLDTKKSQKARKSIVVLMSYQIRCNTLLQNATDIITKCNNFFIIKWDKTLLQSQSGFVLQIVTVYYKMQS